MGCLYIRPSISSLCANLILSASVWHNGLELLSVKLEAGGSNPPIDTSIHIAHLILVLNFALFEVLNKNHYQNKNHYAENKQKSVYPLEVKMWVKLSQMYW